MLIIQTTSDIDKVLHYVKEEPILNLFIIGDIEAFGLDVDFQDVWLQYENYQITSCLLRYNENFVFYAKSDFEIEEVVEKIKEYPVNVINGSDHCVSKLIPYFSNFEINKDYLCELKELNEVEVDISYQIATIGDVPAVYNLIKTIKEFSTTKTYLTSTANSIKNKASRLYYYKQNGKVVSTVRTACETSVSAMIGGVATDISYRGKGYARQLVYVLCKQLLSEGKKPCLFFDNPTAGRIYHELGFEDIGFFTMLINKNI